MSKNLSAKYYLESKERLQKIARERYQNLSKEEKEKRQYGCERYKNLSEDEKQTLAEYRKKRHRIRKKGILILKKLLLYKVSISLLYRVSIS